MPRICGDGKLFFCNLAGVRDVACNARLGLGGREIFISFVLQNFLQHEAATA